MNPFNENLEYNNGDRVEVLINDEWLSGTVDYVDPFCVGVLLDSGQLVEVLFTEVRIPADAPSRR